MKKIKATIIFLIFIILLNFNIVSGYELNLELKADKTDVKVGDEVTITLNLSKGMQAADFTINYDMNLLKFKSTSLANNFYNNTKEPGKIICSWFNTEDTNTFTFTFTAISTGTAKFTTTTENFYDGNLKAASSYNEGNLNVTLLSSQNLNSNNIITVKEQTIDNNKNDNQKEIKQTETTLKTTNANIPLPQTGNNSLVFICMIFGIILIAIISKKKLNKLRDI